MERNFIMKLVTPTAHRTSQKPNDSMVGLMKIRLEGDTDIQVKWHVHLSTVQWIPGTAVYLTAVQVETINIRWPI